MAAPHLTLIHTDPDDPYWKSIHRTDHGHLYAQVAPSDDGVWSSLTIKHKIGRESCLSLTRDDWAALMQQCEQAIRHLDRLEGESNER